MTQLPQHYVIIGNGVAGNEAAWHLRQRDPDSRITIITAGRLLFINRYDLPKLFNGAGDGDWRQFLVHTPEYYTDNKINVRRNTWVDQVDALGKTLTLRHKETVAYDKLLIASGGGGHVLEGLREYRHLMHPFGTYGDAQRMRDVLPKGGHAIMIGGDMIGLDLARALVKQGYKITIAGDEHLFWPHQITNDRRARAIEALEKMGIKVLQGKKIRKIEEIKSGKSARRVSFEGGGSVKSDVVMSFCGLMPSLEFMVGASVDIERGLLVNPELQSTDKAIWAAGDVCQIWSPEENHYRFYYGWKNVKDMGRIAAFNMTGGKESISTFSEENLTIKRKGGIDSPYWEYE
jgi:NAD(P)H-nitrite reductase large subunit